MSRSSIGVEDVLAVPRVWTKKGYNLLSKHDAVPRPWHLEGRWGSRTHKVDNERMGFPIISKSHLLKMGTQIDEIKDLLAVEGVEILTNQPFTRSKRAREPEYFDATIHPERERRTKRLKTEESTKDKECSTSGEIFTYAELFCGIGGFGVALEALGGKCVFVSEIDDTCRDMYMANFKTPHNRIFADIYDAKESDFPDPGTLDLLVGGFPCQPFSNLSHQPGFKCEKGRGLLFQEIIRVLKYSKPKAFLLENVPGLRDMKETYEHIEDAFREAGYDVKSQICSARGLTATSRKRLFFAGLRNDNAGTSSSFQFPFVPDLQLKAENILDYDEMPSEELEILRLSSETMERLLASGRWRPHSLAWPNRPCDTITSHYGNAVGRGESQLVPCHAPYNPRRFAVRECARLMGFPNTFQLIPQKVNQGEMAYRKQFYRMFGNAVCPPVIAVLAGAILDHCSITEKDYQTIDWTEKGLLAAIELSKKATRPQPVEHPMGCLVVRDSTEVLNEVKKKVLHDVKTS